MTQAGEKLYAADHADTRPPRPLARRQWLRDLGVLAVVVAMAWAASL